MAARSSAGEDSVTGNRELYAARAIIPDFDFAEPASPAGGLARSGYDVNAGGARKRLFAYPLGERAIVDVGIGGTGIAMGYGSWWSGPGFPSQVRSFDVHPSLAYAVSDSLAVSMGVDAVYVDSVSQHADCVALNDTGMPPLITCSDAIAYTPRNLARGQAGALGAVGWGYGYNLGASVAVGESTRLGVRYRSGMNLNLAGDGVLSLAGPHSTDLSRLMDSAAIAGLGLPPSFAIGASHQLGERWSVAGDVTWVNWSQLDRLGSTAGAIAQPGGASAAGWENTYRYTLGLNYRHNNRWKYGLGASYDQSPLASKQYSTSPIPGEDLIWVAFGVGYSPNPRLSLDLGYAYPVVMEHRLARGFEQDLAGQFEGEGDILSAQFKWRFE
jgi:long-chain fatty acid transport protein